MSTYEDHLAWLDRQVCQAMADLDAIIAERQGYRDAYNRQAMFDAYGTDTLRRRYKLGWDNGKTKLMLERKEEPCGG